MARQRQEDLVELPGPMVPEPEPPPEKRLPEPPPAVQTAPAPKTPVPFFSAKVWLPALAMTVAIIFIWFGLMLLIGVFKL